MKDLRENGRPVKRSWRLAVAMVGQLQWELIEPLDDESIYARFLAEKGGGVHHIAVSAQSFDNLLAMETKRGLRFPSAVSSRAYLGIERDLGVILEIFNGTAQSRTVARPFWDRQTRNTRNISFDRFPLVGIAAHPKTPASELPQIVTERH